MIDAGTRLGRYEIRSQFGAGGMGEVYRARDEKLNRNVAIKVLPAALSQDGERLRRFEQEAQAAGALNHPNILAVYDVGTHDDAPYIVSELLEGEELREHSTMARSHSARHSTMRSRLLRVWQRRMNEGSLIAISSRKIFSSLVMVA